MVGRHDRTHQIEHRVLFDPEIPDHQRLGRRREPVLGSFVEVEALVAEVVRLVDPQDHGFEERVFIGKFLVCPIAATSAKFHSPTARLAGAM